MAAARGLILVDTNMLIDIAGGNPHAATWSSRALTLAQRECGPAVTNAIVYAGSLWGHTVEINAY